MNSILGMLSKSKGQVLSAFHCLFHQTTDVPDEISEGAIAASINFLGLCCQQTAFLAGRGIIGDEIKLIKESMR